MVKKYYVSPDDFIKEYEKSLSLGKPTDILLKYFTKIAKGFSSTFVNKNKIDYDACVNYAVSEAWRKWDKFDYQNRGEKIFNFFTTMIANDLRQHYNDLTRGKKINISIDALFSNTNK